VFARASAADIQALAAAARETRLTQGATLVAEGEVPAIYMIVSGEVALEPLSGGEPLTAGAGDAFGVYETLSGSETTAWRVHVTRAGLALRVEREVLFDALADRIELLQAMFSAVLRRQPAAVPV
jgi:CRP-like cAMP-binding protein